MSSIVAAWLVWFASRTLLFAAVVAAFALVGLRLCS
jgi:hypothetical protein